MMARAMPQGEVPGITDPYTEDNRGYRGSFLRGS
jgi:hypothetical protein